MRLTSVQVDSHGTKETNIETVVLAVFRHLVLITGSGLGFITVNIIIPDITFLFSLLD